jgi:hypothetical protein
MAVRRTVPRVLALVGGCAGLTAGALTAASCQSSGSGESTPTLTLAPTIVGPESLLSNVRLFSLVGYSGAADAGVTCDASSGYVSNPKLAPPLFTPDEGFNGTGCAAGYTRCVNSPPIPQSATPVILQVVGYGAPDASDQIATACTSMVFDSMTANATATVDLTLEPYFPPAVCGNGMLEPPETCDLSMSADPVCSSTCQTSEVLLDTASQPNGSNTVTNSSTGVSSPSLLWASGTTFLGFFGDTATGTSEIGVRALAANLEPDTALMGNLSAAATESFFLPNAQGGSFPPSAAADTEMQPAAVEAMGFTYVVYAGSGGVDGGSTGTSIRYRSMDASFNAQQSSPCIVSSGTGSYASPAVATNGSSLFIAWQDSGGGNIYGQTVSLNGSTCGALGTQTVLSTTGTTNSHVSVAAGTGGVWWAAWQSGNDAVICPIATNDLPAATPYQVSGASGASPSIAGLGNGNVAVAWASGTGGSATINASRFVFANGTTSPVDGNPGGQINTTSSGGEGSPFISASTAVGGSYVVTWVDQGGTSQVRARLLAGTAGTLGSPSSGAYLYNFNGNTNDFVVNSSNDGAATRSSPTVTENGGAGYMAFSWVDSTKGVVARRFPLPTE